MNKTQWHMFENACNILGLFGYGTKTDLWKFIELFRIPEQLTIVVRHKVVTSIDGLPNQYTPMSWACNAKIYAEQVPANQHKFVGEANKTNLVMLEVQEFEGQMSNTYQDKLEYDLNELKAMLGKG
eukprot:491159_1